MSSHKHSKISSSNVISTDFDIIAVTIKLITPIIIIYIAVKPITAIVFVIDYFKVDPAIAQVIMISALPVLLGITIARGLYYYLSFILLQLEYLLLLSLRLIKKSVTLSTMVRSVKILKTVGDVIISILEKIEDNKVKSIATTVIAIITCSALFVMQFNDNIVGRTWNYKYNKMLETVANLHYNCQVTGAYNDELCREWQYKRDLLLSEK